MKRKRLKPNWSELPEPPPRSGYSRLVLYDKNPPTEEELEQIKQAFDRHEAARRFQRNEIDPDTYGHG